MIHCKKCLTVFTNSVGSGTVLCNGCQPNGDPDIFDTQPTCGELSCDECNERYAKAVERIASLEAERDRLREMVRKLIPWTGACPDYFSDKDDCGKCEHCITRREAENYIAASIGGEGK